MIFETAVSLPDKLVGVQIAPSPCGELLSREKQAAESRDEQQRAAQKEREEIERVLNNLGEAAGSLRAQQHDYLEQMRRLAIELSVAIASHLLHNQIQAGDYPIETMVKHVVARLDTPQPVTVYLHPNDLALLQRRVGKGQTIFPKEAEVHLLADPALGRGGVRAQAGDLSVLGDLDEQLADIRRCLMETLPVAAAGQHREMVRELRSLPESA